MPARQQFSVVVRTENILTPEKLCINTDSTLTAGHLQVLQTDCPRSFGIRKTLQECCTIQTQHPECYANVPFRPLYSYSNNTFKFVQSYQTQHLANIFIQHSKLCIDTDSTLTTGHLQVLQTVCSRSFGIGKTSQKCCPIQTQHPGRY